MKIIFMGTPEFSVNILESLINEKSFDVSLVVTKKDSIGKKGKIIESPVALLAHKYGISVLKLESFKDEQEKIKNLKPDLIVTAAYGKILPEYILNIPKYGCINVHASLLPKYRGSNPIAYALKNGDKKTGVTIMYMDKGMDTGDIIEEKEIEIDDTDNLTILTNKLSNLGSNMIAGVIKKIETGENKRIKQDDGKATYTKMTEREDEHLNFNDTSHNVFNKVRSLSDNPACYVNYNCEPLKIYDGYILDKKSSKTPGTIEEVLKNGIGVSTKDNIYVITSLKPFGKKKMDARSYINGLRENIVGGHYE